MVGDTKVESYTRIKIIGIINKKVRGASVFECASEKKRKVVYRNTRSRETNKYIDPCNTKERKRETHNKTLYTLSLASLSLQLSLSRNSTLNLANSVCTFSLAFCNHIWSFSSHSFSFLRLLFSLSSSWSSSWSSSSRCLNSAFRARYTRVSRRLL